MFAPLVRFSTEEVVQSAWSQILVTTVLRYESAWKTFREWLASAHHIDLSQTVCTGFGPVGSRVGIYLFTADRRVIYAELSELTSKVCQPEIWDDDQLLDTDSVADMVAAYFQSSVQARAWFNKMVTLCQQKEEELRANLKEGYLDAALLQTDEYLEFHRAWLLPLVEKHFSEEAEGR